MEEDHRVKKDWDTFGFSRVTFKKLFDVWGIVHSRQLTGEWWLDVDNLLEDLLSLTGPAEVIDPMDVLMSLIWDGIPDMVTVGLDEACARKVAPWEVFRHLKSSRRAGSSRSETVSSSSRPWSWSKTLSARSTSWKGT